MTGETSHGAGWGRRRRITLIYSRVSHENFNRKGTSKALLPGRSQWLFHRKLYSFLLHSYRFSSAFIRFFFGLAQSSPTKTISSFNGDSSFVPSPGTWRWSPPASIEGREAKKQKRLNHKRVKQIFIPEKWQQQGTRQAAQKKKNTRQHRIHPQYINQCFISFR